MQTLLAPRSSRARAGIALLYSVFATLVAAGMVVVLLSLARSSERQSTSRRFGSQAQYLAEGAVEAAKREIRVALADWRPVPNAGTVTLEGENSAYTIRPTGFNDIVTDASGLQTIVTGFEIEARATVQRQLSVARRVVNAEAVPLFQFAVFYNTDLEILPGPDMTLGGRVHSNRDLFLGCGRTLTLDTNYVHAVGNIYRRRKNDPSASEGTVLVRRWVANPFDPSEPRELVPMMSRSQLSGTGATSASGFDSDFVLGFDADGDGSYTGTNDVLPWGPGALEFWSQPAGYGASGHTVGSAAHGVREALPPSVGSMAMFEPVAGGDFAWDATAREYVAVAAGTGTHAKGRYHAQAGLAILTRDDGTWRAYDASGLDITSDLAGAVAVRSIYDGRQAENTSSRVSVTDIDVEALAASGRFPSNGLIYAAHYGEGVGLQAKGIRLRNGAELPAPLTVVSEDPVYIQGDYNSVAKKGASVIGDAVNLLSNAWDDSKTRGTLPVAEPTTFNVAIVAGNQETEVGRYNGGLENLPRFHENWTGVTCTIRGSFVNLRNSQFATGDWVYGGDRYTAPNRAWAYDPDFNDVTNLPPYTPMAVRARDIVSW